MNKTSETCKSSKGFTWFLMRKHLIIFIYGRHKWLLSFSLSRVGDRRRGRLDGQHFVFVVNRGNFSGGRRCTTTWSWQTGIVWKSIFGILVSFVLLCSKFHQHLTSKQLLRRYSFTKTLQITIVIRENLEKTFVRKADHKMLVKLTPYWFSTLGGPPILMQKFWRPTKHLLTISHLWLN